MGLIRGRHNEVMGRAEYEQARAAGDLPDLYVRSAEYEVELDLGRYADLLGPTDGLSDETKRRIEAEEGLTGGLLD